MFYVHNTMNKYSGGYYHTINISSPISISNISNYETTSYGCGFHLINTIFYSNQQDKYQNIYCGKGIFYL